MDLMNFDLRQALDDLGGANGRNARQEAFRIANTARPPSDYLFARFLPERAEYDYTAKSGTMTVRATMANLVGMDSVYPEGGVIDASTFSQATAKLAQRLRLPERTLRALQEMLIRLLANGQPTNAAIQRVVLNFLDKLIVQPHLDAAEHLRGLALTTGELDVTNGDIHLEVDYGIPSGNFNAQRTGNDAYGGSTSKFWDDIRFHRRVNKSLRFLITHPDTIDEARYNPANSLVTVDESSSSITFRRINSQGNFTQDSGDLVTLLIHGKEGEILDPTAPGTTKNVPFMPRGAIVGIGEGDGSENLFDGVDEGSTEDPENEDSIGYTHLAPTTESGGVPGRWAEVYTPQDAPYTVEGRGASNIMPVIENVNKVSVTTTALS
jgi:hypothetical protein